MHMYAQSFSISFPAWENLLKFDPIEVSTV